MPKRTNANRLFHFIEKGISCSLIVEVEMKFMKKICRLNLASGTQGIKQREVFNG